MNNKHKSQSYPVTEERTDIKMSCLETVCHIHLLKLPPFIFKGVMTQCTKL